MNKISFFWSGPEPILRILLVGTLAYIAIVFTLRIAGKRTLASMNAFDFIITIAIGSAFGRILTAKSVSISEAVTAFLLLALLQFIFSFLEIRFKFFRKLITSDPVLLFYNGKFIDKNMRHQRISKDELMGVARRNGFSSLDKIDALILETDGSFSLIKKDENGKNASYQELIN